MKTNQILHHQPKTVNFTFRTLEQQSTRYHSIFFNNKFPNPIHKTPPYYKIGF